MKSPGSRPPRHVEIWGELEANNRFLRLLAIGACAWAFVALAGTAYALELAFFRPLAFHVDADGRSTFVGRLQESVAPTEPEVRYVARQFLTHYVAMNSLTIESDLAEAWNLMTSELRAEHERQLTEFRRVNDKDFVTSVKEQGIQVVLELPGETTHILDHSGKAWTVRLAGSARTWPLSRLGDPAAFTEREVEAIVTLVRCPRTEKTPNGLLVAKVSTRFFVADPATAKRSANPEAVEPASAPSPGKE